MAGGRSYKECSVAWGASAAIGQTGLQGWVHNADKGKGHQPPSEGNLGTSLGLALLLHISLGKDPKGHEVRLWLDSPYQPWGFLRGRLDSRCHRLE